MVRVEADRVGAATVLRRLVVKPLPFTIALLAFGAGAALAEPPPGRGVPPIDELAAELQLDEHQTAELRRIVDEQRSKMQTERRQLMASGGRPSHEQMREHMRQADEELLRQLQSVLTDEQLENFKKLREDRRRQMRAGVAPPPSE